MWSADKTHRTITSKAERHLRTARPEAGISPLPAAHGRTVGRPSKITTARYYRRSRKAVRGLSESGWVGLELTTRNPTTSAHACLSTWLNGGIYPAHVAE